MLKLVERALGHPKLWFFLLVGYWLLLVTATHVPPTFPGLPAEGVDKIVHAAAFAVLSWLVAMAWQRSSGRLTSRHLWAAGIAIAIYAAVDEVTQLPFGRSVSLGDWLADAVGVALGLIVFFAWNRLARRK